MDFHVAEICHCVPVPWRRRYEGVAFRTSTLAAGRQASKQASKHTQTAHGLARADVQITPAMPAMLSRGVGATKSVW